MLLLDKPLGLSSNAALRRVAFLLSAAKAGHGGTLDPLATGLLPLLFGEATKFSDDLLGADKVYDATLKLGVRTDSGDAEGKVIAEHDVRFSDAQLDAALARFSGEIDQIPPMHSALKRDGRPLYELARQGITVERAPRRVRIDRIEVLERSAAPPTLRLRVACSKGTYIRALADDFGQMLGCGAHLSALRREQVGALGLSDAITIQALEADAASCERVLLPVDALIGSVPRVDLAPDAARRFGHGQTLSAADFALPAGSVSIPSPRVRVYADARLLGVASIGADGALEPLRLMRTDQDNETTPS